MGQDLRELFKEERKDNKHALKMGHEARFLKRLQSGMPKNKSVELNIYKIAATILVLISVGIYSYTQFKTEDENTNNGCF